jgi:lysozyme family protein
MTNLGKSLDRTLLHEGIYSNDPEDPGGETWRGIARNYHPGWVGWVAIDAAKARGVRPQVLEHDPALQVHVLSFYRAEFASPLYEQIAEQEVLDEVFDFGVNVSPPNAVKALQEALRYLQAGPVVVDGIFGPATAAAVNAEDPHRLLDEFRARQSVYYVQSIIHRFIKIARESGIALSPEAIDRATKYATKYALGWLRRVMA